MGGFEGLGVSPGFDFGSFISNPNTINFMAQLGKGLGGPGSVGDVLGSATLDFNKNRQYQGIMNKFLSGKEDINKMLKELLSKIMGNPQGLISDPNNPLGGFSVGKDGSVTIKVDKSNLDDYSVIGKSLAGQM